MISDAWKGKTIKQNTTEHNTIKRQSNTTQLPNSKFSKKNGWDSNPDIRYTLTTKLPKQLHVAMAGPNHN